MLLLTALTLSTLLACGPATLGFDTGLPVDSEPVAEDVRLYLNEFMAANGSWALEPDTDELLTEERWTPDWVEIYNPGAAAVSLAGCSITDDLDLPDKHVLGALEVPAGGHLLLYADGQPELGPAHLPFKLSAEGEALGLFGPEGQPLDRVTFTNQLTDVAAARVPDGGALTMTSRATPGEANPEALDG